jgi:hypothetical protein
LGALDSACTKSTTSSRTSGSVHASFNTRQVFF